METSEYIKNTERWDYSSQFRNYLLLLASKKELGLEFRGNFPKEIELSYGWHRMLGKVRDRSQNGKEHWGFVGFKEDRQQLWFPAIPAEGYDSYIPEDLIAEEERKARDKFGIVDLLGDAHSHPSDFLTKVTQRLPGLSRYGMKGAFSAGDLYIIANTERFRPFMAVIEGDYNLFVFRTKETKGLGIGSEYFNQESFEKLWYEQNGYRYLGGVKEFGANRAIAISPLANPYKVNADIAKRHQLVIYQGKKGKDIKRVYPKA